MHAADWCGLATQRNVLDSPSSFPAHFPPSGLVYQELIRCAARACPSAERARLALLHEELAEERRTLGLVLEAVRELQQGAQ